MTLDFAQMRLMCPNCDAEYEVDASAIPANGRDVQCSNCGHAWFQQNPDYEAEQEAESVLYDPPSPLRKFDYADRHDAAPSIDQDDAVYAATDDPESILDAMGLDARQDDFGVDAQTPDAPMGDDPELPDPQFADAPGAGDAPSYDIDPEAMRILREEAERETAQRLAEQTRAPEPPTGAPTSVAPIVARRVARLKGIQPPAPQPPRERLPAIDDISTALRDGEDEPDPEQGLGNRSAFWPIIIAAGVASLTYALSPDLSAILPQIAGPLAKYVSFVDGLRDGLDALIGKIF